MIDAVVRHNNWSRLSSEVGQKRTLGLTNRMSTLPSKADIDLVRRDIRFVPIADIQAAFGYYC